MPPSTVDALGGPTAADRDRQPALGGERERGDHVLARGAARDRRRPCVDDRVERLALQIEARVLRADQLEHRAQSGGRSCTARYASLIALWVYANASESEFAIATLRNGWRPAYCGWPWTGPYSDGSNVDVSSCA